MAFGLICWFDLPFLFTQRKYFFREGSRNESWKCSMTILQRKELLEWHFSLAYLRDKLVKLFFEGKHHKNLLCGIFHMYHKPAFPRPPLPASHLWGEETPLIVRYMSDLQITFQTTVEVYAHSGKQSYTVTFGAGMWMPRRGKQSRFWRISLKNLGKGCG